MPNNYKLITEEVGSGMNKENKTPERRKCVKSGL